MADKEEDPTTPSDADASADDLPDELADDDGLEPAPEREPASVGARTGSSSGSTAMKVGPGPKGTPTARRDVVAAQERTSPVTFVRQSVGELRKVVYPTGQQLVNYFVVVLVFVLFIIAYVSLLDLGIGWAVFKVFS